MDLILIRHAEAGERDPNSWPDDDLRPVSADGQRKQIAAAEGMLRLGIEFDFLVTSPLLRARQTAEILAQAYAWKEPPLADDILGHGCTTAAVVKLLAKFPPTASVALVGHEPAFSKVAAALVGRSADAALRLRKSGIIGIRFDGPAVAGQGMLEYLLKPGQLRKAARK
jgi:phosphohistidine phosphatase